MPGKVLADLYTTPASCSPSQLLHFDKQPGPKGSVRGAETPRDARACLADKSERRPRCDSDTAGGKICVWETH